MFEGLVDGQRPLALFITCSNSRIDRRLLTQTDPGELFILRNAGNIVPAYGQSASGEAGTIEFAVKLPRYQRDRGWGHSQCDAMSGLLRA